MVESSKTSAMTKLIWCQTALQIATLQKTQCFIVMEIWHYCILSKHKQNPCAQAIVHTRAHIGSLRSTLTNSLLSA